MSIGELIETLKKFDKDKTVLIYDENDKVVECYKALKTNGTHEDCVILFSEEKYNTLREISNNASKPPR